ncbi:hypothetical protein LRR81_09465 [Metabacillus sp. GX 13764]|uniref:hypothetical protein n=1 Tax=Metabacillus kandeliae TaxID=2900151 RepID=UPI001E530486|nr:hypothetical protein [Metabacillus kandeliae]MCD7034465.1 hypothetical protein [Metabacillus kandeliae]
MMKKSLWAFLVVLSLFAACLAGCSSTEADAKGKAAEAMKQVYTAAQKHDQKAFNQLFSHSNIAADELKVSMMMFADKADAAGGVSKLNFTEIPQGKLKEDAAKALKDQYKDNWNVVYEESKVSTPYFWILQNIDGTYYVVNGDESEKKDIVKE